MAYIFPGQKKCRNCCDYKTEKLLLKENTVRDELRLGMGYFYFVLTT